MLSRKQVRHEKILKDLQAGSSLRVVDLAKELRVSTETVRRDLDELTERGQLDRTYGGATRRLSVEPGIATRHGLFIEERERIARAASATVKNGQVLMMGSGATTVHVARRLAAERRDLTVFTHSQGVAVVLAANPSIEVLITPGRYLGQEGAMVGSHTMAFLSGFYADVAILGASGLTIEGATEALIDAGAVYSLMSERSASTMIVADHSKVDKTFPVCFRRWSRVDCLVTDRPVAGALGQSLSASRVDVILP